MKQRNREAGQAVLLLVVLCMTLLLGFAGLATDVGLNFVAKRRIQTAADSAAIAGASEIGYPSDPSSGCTSNGGSATGAVCAAALSDAKLNGLTQGANGTTIVVNKPPAYGPHTSNSNYVEVIATQNQPTIFLGLFGWNPMPVTARAVAYPGTGSSQGCVYTLDTAANGITIKGTDRLSVPNCSVYVDSDVYMNGASSSILAKGVGLVGSKTGNGSITPTPLPIHHIVDPLDYLSPPTVSDACVVASGLTLSQGHYCGIDTKSGNVTLSAGLYVLDGDLCVGSSCGNHTLTGTNVTIYMRSGAIKVGGLGTLNITAEQCTPTLTPTGESTGVCTDGAYNKILIFQSRTNNSDGSIQGSASTNLYGIIYMAHADLSLSGGTTQPLQVGIVVNKLLSNGSINLNGLPVSGGVYPIVAATLAE